MELQIGSVTEGTISRIMNFGAFVDLPGGKSGLIHISEISNTYIEDISKFLKENEKVTVKILGLNDKGKYDLSLKQLIPEAPLEEKKPAVKDNFKDKKQDKTSNFEDKLSRFMKESEERLLDLKRNTENKRGRSRPR